MFAGIATTVQNITDAFTDRFLLKGRPSHYELEVLTDRQAAYIDWQIENFGVGSGNFSDCVNFADWARPLTRKVKPFVFND